MTAAGRRALPLVGLALAGTVVVVLVSLWREGAADALEPVAPARSAAAEEWPELDEASDGTLQEPRKTSLPVPVETATASPDPLDFDRSALTGRVTDPEGEPIAAADVRAYRRRSFPSELLGRTTSGDGGRFALDGLHELTEYDVAASAKGYSTEYAEGVTGRALTIVLAPAITISGRVLREDSRAPIEGAEVWLPRWGTGDLVHAITRADGSFLLADVPREQQAKLYVAAPDGAREQLPLVTGGEPVTGLEVLVGDPTWITLRLVDMVSGTPIPDLEVEVRYRLGSMRSDAQGLLTVPVGADWINPQGRVELGLEAEGYCRTSLEIPDGARSPCEVPLTHGGCVEGQVLDETGAPVADAEVSIGSIKSGELQATHPLPEGVRIGSRSNLVTSDREGRFRLERLVPEGADASIVAHREPWRDANIRATLPTPESTVWVDVVLRSAVELRGRVLVNGAPFVGSVGVSRPEDSGLRLARTNDAGEYRLRGLEPGEADVHVMEEREGRHRWNTLHEETVTLPAEGTLHHDIAFDHDPEVDSIQGIVVDEAGTPMEGVLVYVFEEGTWLMGPRGAVPGFGSYTCETRADGTFTLDPGPDAGTVQVMAWSEGVDVRQEARAGARGLRFVLPLFGELALEVRGAAGERVDEIRFLEWWRAGTPRSVPAAGSRFRLPPEPDGRFHLMLPRRAWDLEVDVLGEAQSHLFGVPVGADPRLETLTLPTGAQVELRFLAADGAVPDEGKPTLFAREELARGRAGDRNVSVWLMRDLRPLPEPLPERVTVPHLAPGTYELFPLPEGWALEPATFEVPDVAHHVVELAWRRE